MLREIENMGLSSRQLIISIAMLAACVYILSDQGLVLRIFNQNLNQIVMWVLIIFVAYLIIQELLRRQTRNEDIKTDECNHEWTQVTQVTYERSHVDDYTKKCQKCGKVETWINPKEERYEQGYSQWVKKGRK
jgi:ABC-type nickel/cobalt efflux system permease component RcnA